MTKDQAIKKKAEWLAYCVKIGFPKTDLDELSAIWDKFKDEHGNLRPQPAPPSTEDEDELWSEAIPFFLQSCADYEGSNITEKVIEQLKSKFILTRK
jgi:hypothetical protein